MGTWGQNRQQAAFQQSARDAGGQAQEPYRELHKQSALESRTAEELAATNFADCEQL